MARPDAYAREQRRTRMLHFGAIALLLLVAAHILDIPAHHLFLAGETQDEAKDAVELREWYQVLRQGGGVWAWLGIAAVLWLCPPRSDAPRELRPTGGELAARVLGAILIAGLIAEALKRVFARERPGDLGDWYSFQPWLEAFIHGSNLGLPSSHAAVAFAGAAVLAAILPKAAPVFWLWAIGCGISRMMTGAHWLSDVTLGAIIGVGVALWLRPARFVQPGGGFDSALAGGNGRAGGGAG